MVPRIAILPQGPVVDTASRLKCEELLVYCGADVTRFLGQDFASIEKTCAYLSKINRLQEDNVYLLETPVILALTRTCPLNATLEMRNRICEFFPELKQAPWVIYVDLNLDPSFLKFVRILGDFENDQLNDPQINRMVGLQLLCEAPLWRDRSSKARYLILTSGTSDVQLVKDQANRLMSLIILDAARGKSSGLSQTFRSVGSGRTSRS